MAGELRAHVRTTTVLVGVRTEAGTGERHLALVARLRVTAPATTAMIASSGRTRISHVIAHVAVGRLRGFASQMSRLRTVSERSLGVRAHLDSQYLRISHQRGRINVHSHLQHRQSSQSWGRFPATGKMTVAGDHHWRRVAGWGQVKSGAKSLWDFATRHPSRIGTGSPELADYRSWGRSVAGSQSRTEGYWGDLQDHRWAYNRRFQRR